jgi:hypothetical protein
MLADGAHASRRIVMPNLPRPHVVLLGAVAYVLLAPRAAAESTSEAQAQRVLAAMPETISGFPTKLRHAVAVPPGGMGAPPCHAAPCEPNPCWHPCPRYRISLGMWIWGIEGAFGDDGRKFDVESDWTDTLEILDKIEFALDARIRGEWGRWSATATVDGARLEDSVSVEEHGVDVDAEFSVWVVQAQVGYGILGGRLGCSPCAPVGCLEAYAGARAWWVNKEVDIRSGSTPVLALDSSDEWIDPIVGLRGEVHFGSRWSLLLEADVGGFGVGSDLSWHALGAVGYHLSNRVTVSAGWKILDVDYEEDDFIFDMTMSGPFLSLTFSF